MNDSRGFARQACGWRRGFASQAAELAGLALLAGAAAWYLLQYMHRGANLLDEGSQVAMANRILHGEVIYRDFLTVAAPGSFYTVAWLFQIFGADLMVVRWAVFALSLGIMVFTLIVARQLMSWPFAAASALLTIVWGWFLVAPNLYSWEAMFFALVALTFYLHGVRRGGSYDAGGSNQPTPRLRRSAEALRAKAEDPPLRTRWLVLSGLACGAAILVKQNTGVYATLGLLVSAWLAPFFDSSSHRSSWRERSSVASSILKGLALIVAPVLVYLLYIGAGPHLYENWIYYPTQMYPRGLRFEYPAFDRQSAQSFVLYLPLLVYPFAALSLALQWIRRAASGQTSREGHALLAVTCFGACTFLQAWPRADATHILFGMQPAFVLLGYVCFTGWRVAARAPQAMSLVLLVVMLVPHALLLRNGYNYTLLGYQNEYVTLRSERAGGVRTSVRNAAQIDRVTEYITAHTAPTDPIFVVPWAAGFYFLTDRPNPTRFDVLLYGDPESYPCLIATLDRRQPRYVIYGYGWDVDGKRFSEYAQPVDAYIRTRYAIAERFDEFEIWRRLENAQPMFRDTTGSCGRRRFDAREFRRLMRQFLQGNR